MLILTERATAVIRSIAEQPDVPDTAGLRIVGPTDGQSGLSASAVSEPLAGDQVIESQGARVFLDAGASERLHDQILDAIVHDDSGIEFVLSGQP
jgi:Fe-S cluster assembly iron-binding protein IscA